MTKEERIERAMNMDAAEAVRLMVKKLPRGLCFTTDEAEAVYRDYIAPKSEYTENAFTGDKMLNEVGIWAARAFWKALCGCRYGVAVLSSGRVTYTGTNELDHFTII